MVRTFIHCLLITVFLGQGWSQAAMSMPGESATRSDCAGHVPSDAGCDCCPDGAMAAGACASVCSATLAVTATAPEVTAVRGQFHAWFLQPVRAGPRYLPLNPPPIA